MEEARHPATRHLMQLFSYEHLQPDLREVSKQCSDLAHAMFEQIPDSPELTIGLRKLLESKDCFVRAAVLGRET